MALVTPADGRGVPRGRKGFAAFAQGDLDTVRELFDPDIVWHEPGRSSVAGDYSGVDATLGFFVQLFERSDGTFQAQLVECGEIAPNLVACLVDVRGVMAAGSLDQRAMILFWNFSSNQYAQDAAWGPAAVAVPDARTETASVTA
jgi:hypothetical protein